jgi:hypothetical protein
LLRVTVAVDRSTQHRPAHATIAATLLAEPKIEPMLRPCLILVTHRASGHPVEIDPLDPGLLSEKRSAGIYRLRLSLAE